jgi:PPP family 3-phenylpropionic acid transporter
MAPFIAFCACYYGFLGLFTPYLPLWLKDAGLSVAGISAIMALQSLSRMIGPYFWGNASDKTGQPVQLLRLAAVVSLVATFGLFWKNPWWMALILFIFFIHTSAMVPMSETAIAQALLKSGSFDLKRYGRIRVWGSIGFMPVVFLSGVWFEYAGFKSFVPLSIASLLLLVLICWRIPNLKMVTSTAHSVPIASILKKPEVVWFFLCVFFHILAHTGIYVFLTLYLDNLGYSKTVIGLMWVASVTTEIIWFFLQSRWLHFFSTSIWLLICSALTIFRMGFTAGLADIWWILLIAQASHAITFAAHHSVCVGLVTEFFPGALRGRGQALYTMIGYGVTGIVGALLGGWLSSYWGLASVFWAGLACASLASFCAWKLYKVKKPQ